MCREELECLWMLRLAPETFRKAFLPICPILALLVADTQFWVSGKKTILSRDGRYPPFLEGSLVLWAFSRKQPMHD